MYIYSSPLATYTYSPRKEQARLGQARDEREPKGRTTYGVLIERMNDLSKDTERLVDRRRLSHARRVVSGELQKSHKSREREHDSQS